MCFHGEIDRASERFVMGRRNGPSIQNSPSPARSASALATAWLAFDEVDAICPAPRWERPRAVLVGAAVVVVRCFSPRRALCANAQPSTPKYVGINQCAREVAEAAEAKPNFQSFLKRKTGKNGKADRVPIHVSQRAPSSDTEITELRVRQRSAPSATSPSTQKAGN